MVDIITSPSLLKEPKRVREKVWGKKK